MDRLIMPRIAVIIPTFNSEKTLMEALESIAWQSETDVEVVVQDGGSQDGTIALAESFINRLRQISIYQESDLGIYDAMNKALQKASAKWVIFMGSDDRFHNDQVLQQIAEVLDRTKADVVYGNARIIGDTGWAKDGDIYDGPFDLYKLLNQNICHQAMFYRREAVLDQVGLYNTRYQKSSDWDYNLRCWAKKPFEYVDLVIADFAAGGFSTRSTDTEIVDDFIDNLMHYFKVGLFDPLLDRPGFLFYPKVVERQRVEAPLRYAWKRAFDRLIKKFNP